MFNKKRLIVIIIVIILLIVGSVGYFIINKTLIRTPEPGSLFDLETFDKEVISNENFVGRSQIEQTSVEVNGLLAYATTSIDRSEIDLIHGSRIVSSCKKPCQILPFNVNNRLLFLLMYSSKPIIIGSEDGFFIGAEAGYYSVGDLFEINNQLVFYASKKASSFTKSSDLFIVYGNQRLKIPDLYDMYYVDGILTILTTNLTEKNDAITSYTKKI